MPPISIDDDGCCRIVMLQATENYLEPVRLLSPLRAAAAWTRADAGDFILVTNHLYDPGASPMACLAIGGGERRFVDVVPDAWRDEATAAFDATLSYMEQLHRDD